MMLWLPLPVWITGKLGQEEDMDQMILKSWICFVECDEAFGTDLSSGHLQRELNVLSASANLINGILPAVVGMQFVLTVLKLMHPARFETRIKVGHYDALFVLKC